MINTIRECQVKGHQDCKPSRICVFKECNQFSRWCCAECMLEKLHSHEKSNENHIKKQQEFIGFLKDQENNQSNNDIHACLSDIIDQIKKLISQFLNLLQAHKMNYRDLIIQATNDFLSIDKSQINEIVNSYDNKFNLSESSDLLQGIFNEFQELQQLYKNCSSEEKQKNQEVVQQQYTSIYRREKKDTKTNKCNLQNNVKIIEGLNFFFS